MILEEEQRRLYSYKRKKQRERDRNAARANARMLRRNRLLIECYEELLAESKRNGYIVCS